MMTIATALDRAFEQIERAFASAESRVSDGGTRHQVQDPRTMAEVALIVPIGDKAAYGAFCPRCMDDGVIPVRIDGAFGRVRCTCGASSPWDGKAATYEDVFNPQEAPLPAEPAPEAAAPAAPPPEPAAWWDREEREIAPLRAPEPEEGALTAEQTAQLRAFVDDEFVKVG